MAPLSSLKHELKYAFTSLHYETSSQEIAAYGCVEYGFVSLRNKENGSIFLLKVGYTADGKRPILASSPVTFIKNNIEDFLLELSLSLAAPRRKYLSPSTNRIRYFRSGKFYKKFGIYPHGLGIPLDCKSFIQKRILSKFERFSSIICIYNSGLNLFKFLDIFVVFCVLSCSREFVCNYRNRWKFIFFNDIFFSLKFFSFICYFFYFFSFR